MRRNFVIQPSNVIERCDAHRRTPGVPLSLFARKRTLTRVCVQMLFSFNFPLSYWKLLSFYEHLWASSVMRFPRLVISNSHFLSIYQFIDININRYFVPLPSISISIRSGFASAICNYSRYQHASDALEMTSVLLNSEHSLAPANWAHPASWKGWKWK